MKRRDLVRMSDTAVWEFIAAQKNVQLATLGKDGWPHLTTLWFAIDEGDVVLETFTKSQKVKNLERDNRITALFESGSEYEELCAVVIYGRAELIRDPEEVHRLHMKVLLRNNSRDYPEEMLVEATRSMVHKKTAIRIVPERIVSWDHGKLDVAY
ncbi:MAG: PPOX class probable F420-dependent enzyme [Bacteroidia bacterium]|jgi:PPOX class probable F420-dependent enzyme